LHRAARLRRDSPLPELVVLLRLLYAFRPSADTGWRSVLDVCLAHPDDAAAIDLRRYSIMCT